jgi:hypothetical protein
MRRQPGPVSSHEAHLARLAWWTAFLATLALIALLGTARAAQALSAAPPPSLPIAAAVAQDDEEEAEAAEEDGFETEECEDDEECDEEEAVASAPQECLLSTADATVSASHDKVRLLVRYTTSSPTTVAVDYGLHGSKGSLYLDNERKRFAAQGSLHLTKRLSDAQMVKVMAAKSFSVRLRVLAAPDYCDSFFDLQLDLRRATPSGLTWSQPE